jgi:hypothetical protein
MVVRLLYLPAVRVFGPRLGRVLPGQAKSEITHLAADQVSGHHPTVVGSAIGGRVRSGRAVILPAPPPPNMRCVRV